jgi:hypothetical protein
MGERGREILAVKLLDLPAHSPDLVASNIIGFFI